MKVLLLSTYDLIGGAGKAAYRMHHALLEQKIDSTLVVQSKFSVSSSVTTNKNKFKTWLNILRPTMDSLPTKLYRKRKKTLFSLAWISNRDLIKTIKSINPDIIHIHWINGGMLNLRQITKLKYPIIWTMHDSWLFTGGCHIPENCEKFKSMCKACPVLGSDCKFDLSTWGFKKKLAELSQFHDLTIIAPSKWLMTSAKQSKILQGNEIHLLPNMIDTKIFSPLEKKLAKKILNINEGKKTVLFSSINSLTDPNKGLVELKASLEQINLDFEMLLFGDDFKHSFGIQSHYFGKLNDDLSLRIIYSAADVLVLPSRQENLSLTIMEALSCGTPAVAFDVGGNSDLINHKVNGYLAKPFSGKDFAYGILWCLSQNGNEISEKAREQIITKYSQEKLIKDYIGLYEKKMNSSKT